MGKRPATLLDIGKALGISPGTVHRALHDNPGVSPMTKAKGAANLRAQSERAGVQRDAPAQRPAQEAAEDVA
jgi:hypothetical protein